MTICIFVSIVFVAFLQFSFGAMNFSSVNRCFQNMYRGMFEACIVTIDSSGNDQNPYFNQKLLKSYVVQYFDSSIKKYSSNYKATLYYTNGSSNDICNTANCNGVKINLDAPINSLFHYQKTRSFYIDSRGKIV